jgi:hypothetical protein
MASNVIQAFNEFMKETVNLSPEDTKKARESRDWLVQQIERFPENDDQFPEIYSERNIYYGSFSRRTKTRPLDDVDLMICLKANGCTYNELYGKIEIYVPDTATCFLDYVNEGTNILNSRKIINLFVSNLSDISQYKKAEIKRNLEAATLNLQSYDWTFDIVPCFFTTVDLNNRTFYIIPDGNGSWKKTDPRLDSQRTTEINSNHDGNVLNVIRAVKYWNKRPTMPTMSSYLIENMILDYYAGKNTKASSFVDIELVDIFLDIHKRVYQTVNDPKNIQGNLNNLTTEEKNKISNRACDDYVRAFHARNLENEKKQKESIEKWREIFGNEFPEYEE